MKIRKKWIGLFVFVGLIGLVSAWHVVTDETEYGSLLGGNSDQEDDNGKSKSEVQPPSFERALPKVPVAGEEANAGPKEPDISVTDANAEYRHAEFLNDVRMAKRIEYLENLSVQGDEQWDSRFLWDHIERPAGGRLAETAVKTSIELAERSGVESLVSAVEKTLSVPSSAVRIAALRHIMDHNCSDNFDTLKEYYDDFQHDRELTLTTIAALRTSDSTSFLVETAQSEASTKNITILAIALLAKTNSFESIAPLEKLSGSHDVMTSKAAIQSLKILRKSLGVNK